MFTGIVEATAAVGRIEPKGGGTRVTLECARPLAKLVLGESIAIDGTCLTVTSFRGRRFTVEVSPETLGVTTLGSRRPGDAVNVEGDILLKQIAAMLRSRRPTGGRRRQVG